MSLFELTLKKALLKAAEDGDVQQVEHLIRDRGISPQLSNANGWTAVHFSSMRGHIDVLMYLIGQGASVTVTNDRGMTPLHLAVFHDHSNIIQALMKAGARSTLHQEDKDGNTPFKWLYGSSSEDRFDTRNEELGVENSVVNECEDQEQTADSSRSSSSTSSASSTGSISEDEIGESEGCSSRSSISESSVQEHDNRPSAVTVEGELETGTTEKEKPEVAWMNSMMSSMRMMSTDASSGGVSGKGGSDDEWSGSSSSMSESDLIDPYAFSRPGGSSDVNDIEELSHDKVDIHKKGMIDMKDVEDGSRDLEIGDLMNTEERCYTYTIGGVVYDWTPPRNNGEVKPALDTVSEAVISTPVQEVSDAQQLPQDEGTAVGREPSSINSSDDTIHFSREAIANSLKVVKFLRQQDIVDVQSAGILKDQIFSGDEKVMSSLQQFLFCTSDR